MTIVENRPAMTPAIPEPQAPTERRTSPLATWRFAARLARREVRRRPGRTLLVMLLIAAPVIAMTGASIVVRSTTESATESFVRQYGSADAVVYPNFENGLPDLASPVLPDLPPGTKSTSYFTTYTTVWAQTGGGPSEAVTNQFVQLSDIDLTNSITDGIVELASGRLPNAPGEALLAPKLAAGFGVAVGDRLTLVRPDVELDIVGIGQRNSWTDEPLMVVVGFDRGLVRPDMAGVETLVDLPDGRTSDERAAALNGLNGSGGGLQTAEGFYGVGSEVGARELAWGWVAGVLAFVAVGIVIAAAFATSARRQLVTIGQLASNGAPPRLVSRTMGLQGMWTGLLGVAVGVPIAVAAGVVLERADVLSRFAGRPIGGLHIAPLDLTVVAITAIVAATLAALVPARSASRIPVLSALAGRRPVAQPPQWLAPVGLAVFCAGLFLMAAAASVENAGDLVAAVAILGALGVVFGMVCASPLIVAAVARVGGRRGGVIRLASRSLGRARARSAAVLTAIAVVGTIATVGSVVAKSAEATDGYVREDRGVVQVNYIADFHGTGVAPEPVDGIIDEPPAYAGPLPEQVERDIDRILPDATWTPISRVVWDPQPFDAVTGEPVTRTNTGATVNPDVLEYTGAVVADEAVLAAAGLDRAQLVELDGTGVLVLSPFFPDNVAIATLGASIEVDVSGSSDLLDTPPRNGVDGEIVYDDDFAQEVYIENRSALSISDVFVSPEFVAENGLDTTINSYRVENPQDITREQYDELSAARSYSQGDAFVETASADGFEITGIGTDTEIDGGWFASPPYPEAAIPWLLIQVAVAVASLVLVLAVVAIGLSLAAAESRDERDVLLAVGASPSTLRRVAATKAWVLTLGAAVVAVPVGYVTVFVIIQAIGANDVTAPFPFAMAAALILIVPMVAWLATLATSTIAQKARPVTATTITAD